MVKSSTGGMVLMFEGFGGITNLDFPFLSKLAMRTLAGSISSACIERLFSMASNFYTHRRKSLGAPIIQAMMSLKLNQLQTEEHYISPQKLTLFPEDFKNLYGEDHPFRNMELLKFKLRNRKCLTKNFGNF